MCLPIMSGYSVETIHTPAPSLLLDCLGAEDTSPHRRTHLSEQATQQAASTQHEVGRPQEQDLCGHWDP